MNLQTKPKPVPKLAAELLARFVAIVGEKYALTDPQAQTPYLVEMRDLYRGHTPVVLRPGSVAEVSAILKLANETQAPRSCRRAAIPAWSAGKSRSTARWCCRSTGSTRSARSMPVSNTMTVEAGVTLQRAREAAAAADRLYPQLLPSEGTCTIGGNLSTNAGGTAAIAHGIARSHARRIGGRARRRPRAQQSQQAQEGQYRLRSQEPVHRRRRHARHHHGGGAAAGAAPALDRDRLCRRALAAGRGRSAGHRHRAHRRRRHLVRIDGALRHRGGDQVRRQEPRPAGQARTIGTC